MADPPEPSGSLWEQVKSFLSDPWPEDDSDEAEALADAWRSAREALELARNEIAARGPAVREAWPDPVGYQLAQLLEQYARDLEAGVLNLQWLEDRARDYARQIFEAKTSIVLEFALMLIPFNYALNPIFGILGKMVARQIARNLAGGIAKIIGHGAANIASGGARGLAKLTATPAKEAAEEVVNDVGTQVLSINRGLREDLDWASTGRAALGGASAGPLAAGLNRVVSPVARAANGAGVPKPIVQGATGATVNAASSPAGGQIGNSLDQGFRTGDFSGLTDGEGYANSYRDGVVISGLTGAVHGAGHQVAHDVGETSGLAQAQRDFALRKGWIEPPAAGSLDPGAGTAPDTGGGNHPPDVSAASPQAAPAAGSAEASAPVPGASNAPDTGAISDHSGAAPSSPDAGASAVGADSPGTFPDTSGTTTPPGSGEVADGAGDTGSGHAATAEASRPAPDGGADAAAPRSHESPEVAARTNQSTVDIEAGGSTDPSAASEASAVPGTDGSGASDTASAAADVPGASGTADGSGSGAVANAGAVAGGGAAPVADAGATAAPAHTAATGTAGAAGPLAPGASGSTAAAAGGATAGATSPAPTGTPAAGAAPDQSTRQANGARPPASRATNDGEQATGPRRAENAGIGGRSGNAPTSNTAAAKNPGSATSSNSAESSDHAGTSDRSSEVDSDPAAVRHPGTAESSSDAASAAVAAVPGGAAAAARPAPGAPDANQSGTRTAPKHTNAPPASPSGRGEYVYRAESDGGIEPAHSRETPSPPPAESGGHRLPHHRGPVDVELAESDVGDSEFDQRAVEELVRRLNGSGPGDLEARAFRERYYKKPPRTGEDVVTVHRKDAKGRFTVRHARGVVELALPKLEHDRGSGEFRARAAAIAGVPLGKPRTIPLDELPVREDIRRMLDDQVREWAADSKRDSRASEDLGEVYAEAFAATLVAERPGAEFVLLVEDRLPNGQFDLVIGRMEGDRVAQFHVIEAKAPSAGPNPRRGPSGRSYLQGHPNNVRGVIRELDAAGRPVRLIPFVVDDGGISIRRAEHIGPPSARPIPSTFVAGGMLEALEAGDLRFHLVAPAVTNGRATGLKVTEYLMDPGLDGTGPAEPSRVRNVDRPPPETVEPGAEPDRARVHDHVERSMAQEAVRVHVAGRAGVEAIDRSGPRRYLVRTAGGAEFTAEVRSAHIATDEVARFERRRPDGVFDVLVSDRATDDVVLDGVVLAFAEIAAVVDVEHAPQPDGESTGPESSSTTADFGSEPAESVAAPPDSAAGPADSATAPPDSGKTGPGPGGRGLPARLRDLHAADASDAGESSTDDRSPAEPARRHVDRVRLRAMGDESVLTAKEARLTDRFRAEFTSRMPGPVLTFGVAAGAAATTTLMDGVNPVAMGLVGLGLAAWQAAGHALGDHRIGVAEKLLEHEHERSADLTRRTKRLSRSLDPAGLHRRHGLEPGPDPVPGSAEDVRARRAPLWMREVKSAVPGALGAATIGVGFAAGLPPNIVASMWTRLAVSTVLAPLAGHYARRFELRAETRVAAIVRSEEAARDEWFQRQVTDQLRPHLARLLRADQRLSRARDDHSAIPESGTAQIRVGERSTTLAHHASTPVDRGAAEAVHELSGSPGKITEAIDAGVGRAVSAVLMETIGGVRFTKKEQERVLDAERWDARWRNDADLAHRQQALDELREHIDAKAAELEAAIRAAHEQQRWWRRTADRIAGRVPTSSPPPAPFAARPVPPDRGPRPLPMNDLSDYLARASWRFGAAAFGAVAMDVVLGSPLVAATIMALGVSELPVAYGEWRVKRAKHVRQREERLAELRAAQPGRDAEFDRTTRFAIDVVDAFTDAELARLGRSDTPDPAQELRRRMLAARAELAGPIPPVDDPRFAEYARDEAESVRLQLLFTASEAEPGRILTLGEAAGALDKVIESASELQWQQQTAGPREIEAARRDLLDAVEEVGVLLPGTTQAAPRAASRAAAPIPPADTAPRPRSTAEPQRRTPVRQRSTAEPERWTPVRPRTYTGPPDPERTAPPVHGPFLSTPPDHFEPPPPGRTPEGTGSAAGPPPAATGRVPRTTPNSGGGTINDPTFARPPVELADHQRRSPSIKSDTDGPDRSAREPDQARWEESCPPKEYAQRPGAPICFSVLPQPVLFALLPKIERSLAEALADGDSLCHVLETGFHCGTLCEAAAFLRYATGRFPAELCVVAHYLAPGSDGHLAPLSRIICTG